jgi:glycosyltransferase involved in cell wall biosynthesis
MFSVVIPLFNKELSITNTLQSVLNQTFKDFEVVIVNDGSTDKSVEKVEAFKDPRIRLIHQENGGVSAARNKGIVEAKNEWITFLDADDLWMEGHLSTLKEIIDNYPNDKVFSTSYIRSNEELRKFDKEDIKIIDNYFVEVMEHQFFWTSVACIHRDVFNKSGFFKTNLNRGEDLELWTRIARKYRFINSSKISSIYRIEAENRSIKSFDLTKSRIFNYNFDEAKSFEEVTYYKSAIVKVLKSFLLKGHFVNFLKLKNRHSKHISYLDILR